MDLKRLLKKAGKGLVIAAASIVAGITLGPIAATAVGGFISSRMGELGVAVTSRLIEDRVCDVVMSGPMGLASIVESRRMETIAEEVAEETGVPSEEALAALQFACRDLQNTMGGVIGELQANRALQIEALNMARQTDAKIDALAAQAKESQQTLEEVRSVLGTMERALDRSYRRVIGSFSDKSLLSYDRLLLMSRLQKQNMTLSSRFDVEYDESLYVPRSEDEAQFEDFLNQAGMSDRNVFLTLGDVGMGKTWFLARLSSRTLADNSPTFFVPLRHGIRGLTGIFQTQSLSELVSLLDSILAPEGKHAFIFLDGLDEMSSREARRVLSGITTARVDTVSIILSCRVADWTSDSLIVQTSHDLSHYIHMNQSAAKQARKRGVSTSISVLMCEFNETEFSAARERYGVPSDVPEDLCSLLKKPYLLRLISSKYLETGVLPTPRSLDFLDMFAGGEDQVHTVLGRLGIITQRDALYETVEQFIESQADSLPLTDLKELDPDEPTFRTLVSSGLLQLSVTRLGTAVSLNPDFEFPLIALAIMRNKSKPDEYHTLMDSLNSWNPELASDVAAVIEYEPVVTEPEPEIISTGKVVSISQSQEKSKESTTPTVVVPAPEAIVEEIKDVDKVEVDKVEVDKVEVDKVEVDEVPELLGLVGDPDASVRRDAIDKLGKLRDPRAVEAIIAALKDEDPKVRTMAVRSLGLIADIRAVEPLRQIADSEEGTDIAIKSRWAADSIAEKARKKKENAE